MHNFTDFKRGMGIGGWMTNYKRVRFLAPDQRFIITIGDKEHFDMYLTRWDVQNIKAMGMDHIRVAFDQVVIEEHDKPFSYREDMLELIDRFIGWCEDEEMKLVLNLHHAIGCYCDFHEAAGLLDDETLMERLVRIWEMFEDRYHDKGVVFEILNEPVTDDSVRWNAFVKRTVNAIRKKNPIRKIIVGGTHNTLDRISEMAVYDDPNIGYTFHNYDPGVFTHQRTTVNQALYTYNREIPYPGDVEYYRDFERFCGSKSIGYSNYKFIDKQYIMDTLNEAFVWRRKHPDKFLWAGEFGTIRHARIEWRENWMRDVISIFKENDIPYCVWNYLSTPYDCNRFSLVDDDRREIVSPEMLKIIRGEV